MSSSDPVGLQIGTELSSPFFCTCFPRTFLQNMYRGLALNVHHKNVFNFGEQSLIEVVVVIVVDIVVETGGIVVDAGVVVV